MEINATGIYEINNSENISRERCRTSLNGLECILTELQRIKLTIIQGARRCGLESEGDDGLPITRLYAGKTVDDNNSKSLLSWPFEFSQGKSEKVRSLLTLGELESGISTRKRESQEAGINLPLYHLQTLFGLSNFEIDILLTCLLPLLDSRFERYYAYLQDDITKKMPTISLILKLFCRRLEDTLNAKKAFYPDAPLVKNKLIHLHGNPAQNTGMVLSSFVQIDERIADYLTGQNEIDQNLRPFAKLCKPEVTLEELVLSNELKERLLQFATRNRESLPVYHFCGVDGSGKRTAAAAICHKLGIPLFYVDLKHMLNSEISGERAVLLISREGLLQNAAIFFDGSDLLVGGDSEDTRRKVYETLFRQLESYPYLVFLGSRDGREIYNFPHNKPVVAIEFPLPGYEERVQLWRKQCRGLPLANNVDLDALANKFRLTADQIADALHMAQSLALWRDPENGLVTDDDLYLVCRRQSRRRLSTLTSRVNSRYTWDDIILPRDQKEQLVEICNQVRYRNTVYGDWGFGRKLIRGKGLNILFSGPSGTGKTMAAEIMGNELGIDLYKIDLSTIVSKYIGETEKNLDRIFSEGTTANAIIFFDEADSLFGKRSEVRDSHDRYANIEISYLLQKMEEYDGVIILATNLRKNIDEAFGRRMHFAVEFPMPEEADRLRIWESIFPEEAPLVRDVDFPFMAKQFAVTGGNIRNIAIASAFLAAQDGGSITMKNIIKATKREFQKIGKLCTETDFAEYYELIKG